MLSQEAMMQWFRNANSYASADGFIGAFPNFYSSGQPAYPLCGTVFLKAPFAEWKDVPLNELNNPNLDDLGNRFRETANYATRNGFIAGLPNFFHADYGSGIVCGTILLKSDAAEWRDVPISELNNVGLSDFAGRFRETASYATRNGFIAGFPNFFHADYGSGIVCGTILLKSNVAEWRDILLFGFLH
jgi:ABC-type transport system substrate-binding protein